jgi:putative CocE/NonD family hydrolase
MRTVGQFPRQVWEIENHWIELSDGCRLAARIWLPVDAEDDPVPAILEYLPYRKRDGTAARDALTHPYFAGHGYACVRVDMRGNGESDGLMADEYLKREQDDALEVIDWIAGRPWCTGEVGMIGISWGGFNGLQVAARRPDPLKAVVTICSTDDRYADDIHYKGGCLLNENLGWASTMFAYSSRPPDPELVGSRWRDMWLERLENTPILVANWLEHPHRDAYWKHGSVCEGFADIEAAVLAVGGWGDAYSNAVPRLITGLEAPARGLVGPWVHKYPHVAVPGPQIGFLQECLRWWDHWLKSEDTDVMLEPLYRAYMMESALPQTSYEHRDGRWIAESEWPSPAIGTRVLALNPGRLHVEPQDEVPLTVRSPESTGSGCGEYCAMWLGPEWPADQRDDDARSLTFDSAPLSERAEIFGAPAVELELEADKPCAFLAVRLCDVHQAGESTRVTYGILNLTHRDSHEEPSPLEPGRRYRVRIQLDDVAYAFPAGHRVRVAISTNYWPLVWPSPEAATVTLYSGVSRLLLPVRKPRDDDEALRPFLPAEAAPAQDVEVLREKRSTRTVERDLASGVCTTRILDDFGEVRDRTHGLRYGARAREKYRIVDGDPSSARVTIHWTETLGRGDWSVRTETVQTMWSSPESFFVRSEMEAFEGEERIFQRTWDTTVPRKLV